MRIDAFTHFMPKRYFERMLAEAGGHADMGKRVRGIPSLVDLDIRLKLVDSFPDYAQILSLPSPQIEVFFKPEHVADVARAANDDQAELVRKHHDQFRGFIAQIPMTLPDAGAAEAERAIKELGACGIQIYSNVLGKPLDRPEFEPLFATMAKLDKPIWIHPVRTSKSADYADEDKSLYEIWWTFGWPYETSTAMARLVFSKILDKYPTLKLIVHHFGGIVPLLEGRIGPGWDQLGTRTSDADYVTLRESLKKRPIDYFRENFIPDTAVFGSRSATVCGLDFYPHDRIVFASDCPFDPEKGPGYIRETMKILDTVDLSKEDRAGIYSGNLERLTGMKFT